MINNDTLNVKERVTTVRARTWIISIALIVSLILYLFVAVSLSWNVDIVAFCVLAFSQISIHCAYFPDGEEYGQKNATFIANKKAYNSKATKISRKRKIADLRDYCLYEFEVRKRHYVESEVSAIGITWEEYENYKKLKPRELLRVDDLDKKKKHRLYKLIYTPLPVKPNTADTIMSAVQNEGDNHIKDDSVTFKKKSYVSKILKATVVALFLSLLVYKTKDGVTLDTFVQMAINLTSIIATAVMSFTTGETCQKVYKNKFYVDLANFIDGFYDWEKNTKGIELDDIQEVGD